MHNYGYGIDLCSFMCNLQFILIHTGDKPLEFIMVPKCPLFGDSTVLHLQISVENGGLILIGSHTGMSKYFYDNTSGTKLVIVTTMTFKCGARAPKYFLVVKSHQAD